MPTTPTQESIVQSVVDDFANTFIGLTGFLTPDKAFAETFKDADTNLFNGIETYEQDGEKLPHTTSAFVFFPDINIVVAALMHQKNENDVTGKITVSAVYGQGEVLSTVKAERTFAPDDFLD